MIVIDDVVFTALPPLGKWLAIAYGYRPGRTIRVRRAGR